MAPSFRGVAENRARTVAGSQPADAIARLQSQARPVKDFLIAESARSRKAQVSCASIVSTSASKRRINASHLGRSA